ncbi:MAG: hypothetical protein JW893_04765 [Candidatus Omnitrophica bacterium]|nr:hypothetical protein [Candidatus Omnitrophota bacterium]
MKNLWHSISNKVFCGSVNSRINDLVDHLPYEQLDYDVTKFVVFNQIPGDYLEFGVYEGRGLVRMYKRMLYHWKSYARHAGIYGHEWDPSYWDKMRFIAFDSFEGLPEAHESVDPKHFSKQGIYQMPLCRFQETLRKEKLDLSKVLTVPGWFKESLTDETKKKWNIEKACAIFIDCDLYESGVPVFRFITDLIQDGTVLIIDDFFRYGGHPQRGLQRAYGQWLEQNPQISTSELTRQGANRLAFVCHKD